MLWSQPKTVRDGIAVSASTFAFTIKEAREQCQGLLPDIARDELPDGELHTVTCDVRDEADRAIYRGRLTYEGTRDPT